jgi:hypothetical protein
MKWIEITTINGIQRKYETGKVFENLGKVQRIAINKMFIEIFFENDIHRREMINNIERYDHFWGDLGV